MTTPSSPSPASGPGVSPDALAQVQAQLEAAKIAAKAARRNAWLAVIGAVLTGTITGLATYYASHNSSTSGASGSASQLALGPFEAPNGDSNIPWTISLSGPVSGLKPGQMVWTLNESLKTPGIYYPDTGPCSVSAGTWTCTDLHIGIEGKSGLGKYRIWAVVVSSSDAFEIVDEIRCFPSGILSIHGVTLKPACQDSSTSLPGSDLVAPENIQVTRVS
jgi:hypothetical protein